MNGNSRSGFWLGLRRSLQAQESFELSNTSNNVTLTLDFSPVWSKYSSKTVRHAKKHAELLQLTLSATVCS